MLIAIITIISALVIALIFWQQPFEEKLYACVYIDGGFVEALELQEELDTIEMKTQYGTNTLMILDFKVYMKESDCALNQCVNSSSISRPGQSIVCAPHGLVITIEDERNIGDK